MRLNLETIYLFTSRRIYMMSNFLAVYSDFTYIIICAALFIDQAELSAKKVYLNVYQNLT